MKATVQVFPKQKIAGVNVLVVCGIYTKNDIEYRIYHKTYEKHLMSNVEALDSSLACSGFERVKVGIADMAFMRELGCQLQTDFNFTSKRAGIITGYADGKEWFCEPIEDQEGRRALQAYYGRMAYQDGAVKIR